jgi:D-alanyl-D-alanine carboxypeptidase
MSTSQRREATAAALREVVDDTAAGRLLPGVHHCLLRIENRRWPEGWVGAAGGSDSSAFRIASVTKVVTAAAALTLVDRGHLHLDEPIARYLPATTVDRVHVLDGRSYGAAITVRQLLDHTSGLPNFFSHPRVHEAIRDGRGLRRFTPSDLLELAIDGGPPSFAPGLGREYTDTGFLLAGLIIERLTSTPLQGAYRELVLDRAGMTDTWLESSDEAPRSGPVMAHELDGDDITAMDPTVDWAGGGLVSTVADLAAFLRSLRDGRLLTSAALGEMTRWTPGPAGFYDDYGLGLGRYRLGSRSAVGHHGVWGAFAFEIPELDTIVTGTVNTGRVDRRPLLAAVVDAIVESS